MSDTTPKVDLEKLEQSVGVEVPAIVTHTVTPLVDLILVGESRALTEQVIRLAIQIGYHAAEKDRARIEKYEATYGALTLPPHPPQGRRIHTKGITE